MTSKTEYHITPNSNWDSFNEIANILISLGASFVKKYDGLDQRYWDFEYKDFKLTLHLEHYTGIYIYSDSNSILDELKIKLGKEFNNKN